MTSAQPAAAGTLHSWLKPLLVFDLCTAAASVLVQRTCADVLLPTLGVSHALMNASHWVILPFVLGLVALLLRPAPPVWGVRAVAAANSGWVLASLWLLLGSSQPLTALGQAYVLLQALLVAALAGLQCWTTRPIPGRGPQSSAISSPTSA